MKPTNASMMPVTASSRKSDERTGQPIVDTTAALRVESPHKMAGSGYSPKYIFCLDSFINTEL
jgi:hypothetical protein